MKGGDFENPEIIADASNRMIGAVSRLLPEVARKAGVSELNNATITFTKEESRPRFLGFSRQLKEKYQLVCVPDEGIVFRYFYNVCNENDSQEKRIRTYVSDVVIGNSSKLVMILNHQPLLMQIGSF